MRKLKLLIATLMVCVFALSSGCFFAQGESGSGDKIEADQFELDPNKEYSIEFMMWGAKDEQDNYAALVDKFMDEYPNIIVNITTQDATQYMSTLTGKLSGTMPDLFYLPEYEFRPWVDSGRR